MGRLWDYCAFCGKRIETGEKCYGLPNGESVCTDCCVEENEGAAVSNGEEEQEDRQWQRLSVRLVSVGVRPTSGMTGRKTASTASDGLTR